MEINYKKYAKVCVVCGYNDWGDVDFEPGEICPCCGEERGFDDYKLEDVYHYRKKWVETGCKWVVQNLRPENWNYDKQQKNIPEEYRKME